MEINEALKLYSQAKIASGISENTVAWYRMTVRRWMAMLPQAKRDNIGLVDKVDCEALFRSIRFTSGEFSAIARFFEFADDRGWIEKSPFKVR